MTEHAKAAAEIQRYQHATAGRVSFMYLSATGAYVDYHDHLAATAELRAENDRLRKILQSIVHEENPSPVVENPI